MLLNENIEKILYHATTSKNANDIIKNKNIKIIERHPNPIYQGRRQSYIKKDPGSLGYGFYLFSDQSLADSFRIEKVGDTSDILMMRVIIPKGTLLDLTNEDILKKYNTYKSRISKEQAIIQAKIVFQNSTAGQSALEGFMVDYYIGFLDKYFKDNKLKLKINCVRGFTATQISHSRGSYVANGIEYCLKYREIVEDIEILEEENNNVT